MILVDPERLRPPSDVSEPAPGMLAVDRAPSPKPSPRRYGKPFDMDAERYRLRLQGLHRGDKSDRNRAKRLRRAFRGEIVRLRGPNGLRTAGLFWRGGGHPTKADRAAIQRFLRAWLLGDGAPQVPSRRRGHR